MKAIKLKNLKYSQLPAIQKKAWQRLRLARLQKFPIDLHTS